MVSVDKHGKTKTIFIFILLDLEKEARVRSCICNGSKETIKCKPETYLFKTTAKILYSTKNKEGLEEFQKAEERQSKVKRIFFMFHINFLN